MLFEKRWASVSIRVLTANGTVDGVLTIADSRPCHVGQRILLKSNTQVLRILKIKRITSKTTLEVGLPDSRIEQRSDVSAFLVADSASFIAEEQTRPAIGSEDFQRAVYAEEPAIAVRSILVDELGEYYNEENPLPTSAVINVDSLTVSVALDAFTKLPADNAIAVGTEDGTKTGVKHALKIGSDGKAEVKDTAVAASVAAIDSKLASPLPLMTGAATAAKQDVGNASLAAIQTSDASIDSKLNTLGQKNMAGSVPVTLASDQDPIRTIQLFTKPFKAITRVYPDPSAGVEVYQSRLVDAAGPIQETATVTYADGASKQEFLKVVVA